MTNKIWLNKKRFCLLVTLTLVLTVTLTAAEKINLAGNWQFALDRDDKGIADNWFDQSLPDKIVLPGALQSQNFGDPISTKTPWVLSLYDKNWFLREDYKDFAAENNVKVPFLSQPPKHYLGAAWYNRDIEIPASWQGKRIVLFLERPHWESTVWLDGQKIGSNLSLVAEHEYDLGNLPAGRHKLSIRVDNRMLMNYRPDAHSVSDSLGMSWNGIIGKIELGATGNVWIEDAQVFTNLEAKTAAVKIKTGNSTGKSGSGTINANGKNFPVSWNEKAAAQKSSSIFRTRGSGMNSARTCTKSICN